MKAYSEMSNQRNQSSNSLIATLASRQLEAYNQADLEAFCACYHPNVLVYDAQGKISVKGAEAFRSHYAPMFAQGKFGAEVPERIIMGEHCIDHELYWREATDERKAAEGEVLVRYRLVDNLIGEVQFFY